MKKPLIALIPQVEVDGRWWLNPDYMESVVNAGGIPAMLPLTENDEELEEIARRFDGFLFTGGPDVDPALYGQQKEDFCGEICQIRDDMEMKLFRLVFDMNKPILGICRGIQLMNVALGGTLYQDIPTQAPSEVPHRVLEKPLARETHEIIVESDCPFGNLPLRLMVNSRHHQAIDRLAPGLKVRARATDGIIEAVYMPERPNVRAVQWHPENFRNDLSRCVFEEFIGFADENFL